MRPSAEAIALIILRDGMPARGPLDTVKSTPSIMDDPSIHVIDYRSYWLSVSVVFTLKYIMCMSIFVSGGSKEPKNGALKVVDVAIFSWFENI